MLTFKTDEIKVEPFCLKLPIKIDEKQTKCVVMSGLFIPYFSLFLTFIYADDRKIILVIKFVLMLYT